MVYVTPALSPGVDIDAITLSDEHVFPQLESGRISKHDKFKKSVKLVQDAENTAHCLMFFNSFVAVAVMLCAMFAFGESALDNDVDGAFIAFYIMVFCFFLLMFEARRKVWQGKPKSQEESEREERELSTGIIDEQNLKKYGFHTRFRYHFGFMFDSNLRVAFMFFVSLECFALGRIGMIAGIIFAVAALVNAFIRCTRPRLYTNLNEPRIRLPPPMDFTRSPMPTNAQPQPLADGV